MLSGLIKLSMYLIRRASGSLSVPLSTARAEVRNIHVYNKVCVSIYIYICVYIYIY